MTTCAECNHDWPDFSEQTECVERHGFCLACSGSHPEFLRVDVNRVAEAAAAAKGMHIARNFHQFLESAHEGA